LKGQGEQSKAAFVQIVLSFTVHMPLCYYLGVTKKWLGGLWLGLFIGNCVLCLVYGLIVCTRNWEEIAEKVHEEMKEQPQ